MDKIKCNVPKVTEEQMAWLQEKLAGKDIIFTSIHGSHLYGLDRPESDIDFKAIYLPTQADLLTGKSVKTYQYKNEDLDVELELKSLPSFLQSAATCDTNCIDLTHTPPELVLSTSPMWKKIMETRSSLYSKDMRGMIGYIKVHSRKYTNKIDRFNEMRLLLSELGHLQGTRHSIEDFADLLAARRPPLKYTKIVTLVKHGEQKYLEVCGKKYIFTWNITQLREALNREIARYGERTASGVSSGLDAKSLSHALRVLFQLQEILTTKTLKFPLKDAEFIKDVKVGKITDKEFVMESIDRMYEECMALVPDCGLPEETDITEMYDALTKHYFHN